MVLKSLSCTRSRPKLKSNDPLFTSLDYRNHKCHSDSWFLFRGDIILEASEQAPNMSGQGLRFDWEPLSVYWRSFAHHRSTTDQRSQKLCLLQKACIKVQADKILPSQEASLLLWVPTNNCFVGLSLAFHQRRTAWIWCHRIWFSDGHKKSYSCIGPQYFPTLSLVIKIGESDRYVQRNCKSPSPFSEPAINRGVGNIKEGQQPRLYLPFNTIHDECISPSASQIPSSQKQI